MKRREEQLKKRKREEYRITDIFDSDPINVLKKFHDVFSTHEICPPPLPPMVEGNFRFF